MNYAALKKFDIANGPGVRVSLFVSGCRHRCKNCFNKEAWDFSYGKPFTESTEREILNAMSAEYITGLSLLGGEPFEPENRPALTEFLKTVKKEFPEKSVWCYTGFRLEDELLRDGSHPRCAVTDDLLSCIDVLVDGRFVAAEKDIRLQFRGSRNQRVLDLPKTLAAGQPVIWEQLEK